MKVMSWQTIYFESTFKWVHGKQINAVCCKLYWKIVALTWLSAVSSEQLYLIFLLNIMLSRSGRGLYFFGMDSHVFRPIITAFCFPL